MPVKKENNNQLQTFESAMSLFHKRDFRAALPLFAEAAAGSDVTIAHTSKQHQRICEHRLGTAAPELKTAEEHYHYGIGLIVSRKLEEAAKVLRKAVELEPRAGHMHYALGICLGLAGDLSGAARHLGTAIQLDPKNRSIARTDPDFLEFGRHSPVRELVFLEKKERETQLPS
jgi:tetratricopeptide (TPR) repeat protein